jgi:chromate reductase, NAD(P)H dehydrogenase (quinone)
MRLVLSPLDEMNDLLLRITANYSLTVEDGGYRSVLDAGKRGSREDECVCTQCSKKRGNKHPQKRLVFTSAIHYAPSPAQAVLPSLSPDCRATTLRNSGAVKTVRNLVFLPRRHSRVRNDRESSIRGAMRILGISGSLRAGSTNTLLLRTVAALAPTGMHFVTYDGLGRLPHFNPDLDPNPGTDVLPEAIRELRAEVGLSDGLLICSPEYAHGIAGSMKNALDWLVGSVEFPGKPVAVLNASPRAVHADAQIREILTTMSARLVERASIVVPVQGTRLDVSGIVSDPALSALIRDALTSLASAVRASANERA